METHHLHLNVQTSCLLYAIRCKGGECAGRESGGWGGGADRRMTRMAFAGKHHLHRAAGGVAADATDAGAAVQWPRRTLRVHKSQSSQKGNKNEGCRGERHLFSLSAAQSHHTRVRGPEETDS